MEEKVKKVEDTITDLQTQVQELQLKNKLDPPLEEREGREKVNEASSRLQQLIIVQLECVTWNKVSLTIYEILTTAPETQEVNKKVQECDEKSVYIRAYIMMLTPNVHINTMQEKYHFSREKETTTIQATTITLYHHKAIG